MAQSFHCPQCGAVFDPVEQEASVLVARDALPLTVEMSIPGTVSGDECGDDCDCKNAARQADLHPGGQLGFVGDSPKGDSPPQGQVGSAEFAIISSPPQDPFLDALREHASDTNDPPGAYPHPATLNVDVEIDRNAGVVVSHGKVEEVDSSDVTVGTWAWVLLSTYASVVTIALAFTLWSQSRKREPIVDSMLRPTRLESGPAELRLEPLPEASTIALGKALVVGDLEIRPRWVGFEQIELRRTGGDEPNLKIEPERVLVLLADLRNLSADRSFAPLQAEFVRESETGTSETILEGGSRAISSYPLARKSELSIVGQSFDLLPPVATSELKIVSDREPDLAGVTSWTWRIRLRVSPSETRMIGVKFTPDEIQ